MIINLIDKERIKRHFNGVGNADDAIYVEELFRNETHISQLRYILLAEWEEFFNGEEQNNKNMSLDHILHKIYYQANAQSDKKTGKGFKKIAQWGGLIAAGIAILLAVYIGSKINPNSSKDAWAEITAPAWSRVSFSLPDGTTGSLNSNSILRYNLNKNGVREVNLSGEAYFNVFKDKKRPFILETSDIQLEVTGTKFNVAAYQVENITEVVLAEGGLILGEISKGHSYEVVPSELYTYNRSNKSFSKEVVQPEKYTSWTHGKLVFRNDPIDEVARRLGRWYNVEIEVDAVAKSDLRLRATFIDEELEEVLKLLKLSLPIDYQIITRKQDSDGVYLKNKVILTSSTS